MVGISVALVFSRLSCEMTMLIKYSISLRKEYRKEKHPYYLKLNKKVQQFMHKVHSLSNCPFNDFKDIHFTLEAKNVSISNVKLETPQLGN